MVRLYVVLGVVAVAFYIFSIVDCALSDRVQVRTLPKAAWVLIVLIPIIGGILWLVFGRARRGSVGTGARGMAPDDDPEFLGSLRRKRDQDERIRRLEKELGNLDDKGGDTEAPGRKDA